MVFSISIQAKLEYVNLNLRPSAARLTSGQCTTEGRARMGENIQGAPQHLAGATDQGSTLLASGHC